MWTLWLNKNNAIVAVQDVLSTGGLVSHSNALFLGSTLPYLFSWAMYKVLHRFSF